MNWSSYRLDILIIMLSLSLRCYISAVPSCCIGFPYTSRYRPSLYTTGINILPLHYNDTLLPLQPSSVTLSHISAIQRVRVGLQSLRWRCSAGAHSTCLRNSCPAVVHPFYMDKCVWIPLNDDEKPELAFNLDGKLYSPGYASSF